MKMVSEIVHLIQARAVCAGSFLLKQKQTLYKQARIFYNQIYLVQVEIRLIFFQNLCQTSVSAYLIVC